jgi:hypothetical protein
MPFSAAAVSPASPNATMIRAISAREIRVMY